LQICENGVGVDEKRNICIGGKGFLYKLVGYTNSKIYIPAKKQRYGFLRYITLYIF